MSFLRFERFAKNILGVSGVRDPSFLFIRKPYRRAKERWILRKVAIPPFATVEVTTRCNSRCTYCARLDVLKDGLIRLGDITRQDFLFHMKELASLGTIRRIVFGGLGEPTLHPDLPLFAKQASQLHPEAEILLITNGISLTPRLSKQIVGSGLTHITVSMNSFNPDVYKTINAVDKYETVVENVQRFLEIRGRRRPALNMQIFDIDMTRESIENFQDYWTKLFRRPNDQVIIQLFQNSGGRTDPEPFTTYPLPAHRFPCLLLWYGPLQITYEGDVYPCCIGEIAGAKSSICLGNLHETPLLDLFRGDYYLGLRQLHLSSMWNQIDLCRVCDLWHRTTRPFLKIGRRWI